MNDDKQQLDEQLRGAHEKFAADHDSLREQLMNRIDQEAPPEKSYVGPLQRIGWTWARSAIAAAIVVSFALGFSMARMTGQGYIATPPGNSTQRPVKQVEVVLVRSSVAHPFVFTQGQEKFSVDIKNGVIAQ